ncbi:type I restriction endonuclease subunit R, EcoR124 family, partial [Staphylococcus aureus]
VVKELEERFPDPSAIAKEADKKAFAKLFGEYLRVENILQNYDEFAKLKELQEIDQTDAEDLTAFKERYHLSDDDVENLKTVKMPA